MHFLLDIILIVWLQTRLQTNQPAPVANVKNRVATPVSPTPVTWQTSRVVVDAWSDITITLDGPQPEVPSLSPAPAAKADWAILRLSELQKQRPRVPLFGLYPRP